MTMYHFFQIVYALEQVQSITSETAETPNEKRFQDEFQATIDKALNALRTPKDPSHPLTSWTLFKQVSEVVGPGQVLAFDLDGGEQLIPYNILVEKGTYF